MGKYHPWDNHLKRLFTEASEAFVYWLVKDAIFVQLVSPALEGEDQEADILCEILQYGQKMLLHIEFQKKRDTRMAQRLWKYNMDATIKYNCPVWSVVIYLTRDSAVETPYCVTLPGGQPVHRFDFAPIRLWEIPTAELLSTGLRDLAPLLPLTREGLRHEVVEQAIELLDPPDGERKGELLTLTYGLASLAFISEADQDWLARRFGMLYDILKDTRAFQDLARESRLIALQEGRQEGRQEGLQEGVRVALLDVIAARFTAPDFLEQARANVALIKDLETLHRLVVQAALLPRAEELATLLAQATARSSSATPADRRSHTTGKKRTTRKKKAGNEKQ